jgi:hypothetical protein
VGIFALCVLLGAAAQSSQAAIQIDVTSPTVLVQFDGDSLHAWSDGSTIVLNGGPHSVANSFFDVFVEIDSGNLVTGPGSKLEFTGNSDLGNGNLLSGPIVEMGVTTLGSRKIYSLLGNIDPGSALKDYYYGGQFRVLLDVNMAGPVDEINGVPLYLATADVVPLPEPASLAVWTLMAIGGVLVGRRASRPRVSSLV